jgi:sugar lactone lactonase YvrE
MLAVDDYGNLFIADKTNATIRLIDTNGMVSTFAGSPGILGTNDDIATSARFISPNAIAIDSTGNMYVSDGGAHTIRKITATPTNWVVSTVAGSPGVAGYSNGVGSVARFNDPVGVAVDINGNVFVTDFFNRAVRKITPDGAVTTLVRGNSFGGYPNGIAVDAAGVLYVADFTFHIISTISLSGTNWVTNTFAGRRGFAGHADGVGTNAFFDSPYGVTLDSCGNLYTCDHSHTVRRITPSKVVTTLAGRPGLSGTNDGVGADARFYWPQGLAIDKCGNIYVADFGNNRISKGTPVLQFDSRAPDFGYATNGTVHFPVLGPCGSNIVISSSADLTTWSPVSTNTLELGSFDFETEITNQSNFFRAAVSP